MFSRKLVLLFLTLPLLILSNGAFASTIYKPFILAYEKSGDFQTIAKKTESQLKQAGFEIVGTYQPNLKSYHPYQAAKIFIITNKALLSDAAKTSRGGYGATMRVSVTKTKNNIQVAYSNPVYIQYAYRMKADLKPIKTELGKALGDQKSFGAKGLTASQLEHYHYTFGMEYFNEPYHLNSYGSHHRAVVLIKKKLLQGDKGIHYLYQLNIPGTDQTIFGVSMDSKSNKDVNDAYQMSVVDFKALKGTAYLPYQILVKGSKAEALNMRFRMAVFFPDLSMMGGHSFMTLMSAPSALHHALAKATGGSYNPPLF